jgi:hypothetical protein
MQGRVHEFDPRVRGRFRMSLVYEGEHRVPGKMSENTDSFHGRFVELIPGERVLQAVEFDSKDPELAG